MNRDFRKILIGGVIMLGTIAINALTTYQTKEDVREMVKEELALQQNSNEEKEEA